ncbi:Phosphopantothenate--cysteine ligase cab2 [Dimargaris verticillata]|uniref:Phosphopantothenate--cysteine ligase cab2 n=1 Tax=Dimargaris verticillata TaxID=2761393 RepID=A0A9W8AXT5_9FUNG|nr:Phosphopantothenate--cysteine ligase cab2 [Dimargaris verticillata]
MDRKAEVFNAGRDSPDSIASNPGAQSVLESRPYEQIDPDTYFTMNSAPTQLPAVEAQLAEFVTYHQRQETPRIVLVTSGGTIVPLENQTVRFIDNFSAGTRGAASAEYFLQAGYAVIFMHRERSLQPFNRHFAQDKAGLLDYLCADDADQVSGTVQIQTKNLLLLITFMTVADYLFVLRSVTNYLTPFGSRAMYYLAAAVSDFFIPAQKMTEHKIQSAHGGLTLTMDQVPKFLRPLVHEWAPQSYIVSFKLETDERLLIPKAKHALMRYGHQVVIGNLLLTRKRTVTFITRQDQFTLSLTNDECQQTMSPPEIEAKIVDELVRQHTVFVVGSRA